uniref:tRNA(Phe) (4-demethylwyosine(37)-C(7)) aminocarboxypropyltransferase n=1 Tax=Pseudo-nitzschia australis TaxID=44445 RepID=A0A7S4ANR9_9STRA
MGKPKRTKQQRQKGTSTAAHGEEVARVAYVRKEHAKIAKSFLQEAKLLDDRFRMLPATGTALAIDCVNANAAALIAIPVCEEFNEKTIYFGGRGSSGDKNGGDNNDNENTDCLGSPSSSASILVGVGYQTCPYSTKMLGNCRSNRHNLSSSSNSKSSPCKIDSDTGATAFTESLSIARSVILDDVLLLPSAAATATTTTTNTNNRNEDLIQSEISSFAALDINDNNSNSDHHRLLQSTNKSIIDRVLQLNSTVCPGSRRRPFLEIFGDDRTVVVPPGAFEGEEFCSILRDVQRLRMQKRTEQRQNSNDDGYDDDNDDKYDNNNDANGYHFDGIVDDDIGRLYDDFWRRLASAHNSPRVVRRGGIDPNSKVRESGHRILWPRPLKKNKNKNNDFVVVRGPQSPSWIRVTEQGIKQSFDLTKVMFSRGNISEKIRFGKQLVREGEIVLDLYAGIGYYTLPAIIHGRASKVYACEWNENAVHALRFNVRDNKIEDKVEIFVGDCRESVKTHKIVDLVDRVSLGLLPSSEGGWRAAIRALRAPSGGWLHVHGNAPSSELESWTLWLCHRLDVLAREENRPRNWWILCNHVERVKSFAPTVFHYVADVFVGSLTTSDGFVPIGETFLQETNYYGTTTPLSSTISTSIGTTKGSTEATVANTTCKVWMRKSSDQNWIPALKETVVIPSCALSPDGVLSQDWMR